MSTYAIYDASWLSILMIVSCTLLTPLYVLATYAFSNASLFTGMKLASAMLVFGTVMTYACLVRATSLGNGLGTLIIPLAWFVPSILLFLLRNYLLKRELSQKWIVGLQLFRVVGAAFLIEYARDNIPAVFSYPAGLGDIFAGIVAGVVLWIYRKQSSIPARGVYTVIAVGMADFIMAFVLGFGSSGGVGSFVETDYPSKLILFPTGMIPLFLVPYFIFYHTLSLLVHFKFGRRATTTMNNKMNVAAAAASSGCYSVDGSADEVVDVTNKDIEASLSIHKDEPSSTGTNTDGDPYQLSTVPIE